MAWTKVCIIGRQELRQEICRKYERRKQKIGREECGNYIN
jgi:hypothetical protein